MSDRIYTATVISCLFCPHSWEGVTCRHDETKGRRIEGDGIPKWCPLPKARAKKVKSK